MEESRCNRKSVNILLNKQKVDTVEDVSDLKLKARIIVRFIHEQNTTTTKRKKHSTEKKKEKRITNGTDNYASAKTVRGGPYDDP